MVEGMLEKHDYSNCKGSQSLYWSGLKIDCIEHDNVDSSQEEKIVQEYQFVVGGLNCLTINTQPDINAAYSLLSQFSNNLSQGYLEIVKYVLWYLKHTSSHGIWFR